MVQYHYLLKFSGLVSTARVDLDNKNVCVKTQLKKYRESQSLMGGNEYTKEEARAYAYSDCTFNNWTFVSRHKYVQST